MSNITFIENQRDIEQYYLSPGELHVTAGPRIITTILGSCISLCLWDESRQVGGINHYVLPAWSGRDNSTNRYGDVANYALFDKMRLHGSEPHDIRALIIGGSNMLQEGLVGPGMANIALAEEFLSNAGIRNVRSFTGGSSGRKVLFNTSDGTVEITKVGNIFKAA